MKSRISLSMIIMLSMVSLPSPSPAQDDGKMEVARMVLCEGIEAREPSNASDDFSPDINQVYCFTEVVNAGEPTTITHMWYFGDKLMAEIPLDVMGNRFRTWSSKRITPHASGTWRVEAVDEAGEKLGEIAFKVSPIEETSPEE